MKTALVFNAMREGYGIDQLRNPMTVGELMELLEDYEEDDIIVMSHDNGYTYGSISFIGEAIENDDEWELQEW